MGGALRVSLILLFTLVSDVFALWPAPRQMTNGTSTLKLSNDFSIDTAFSHPSSDLLEAISRTESFLKNDKLGPLVIDRGASQVHFVATARLLSQLVLHLSEGNQPTSISSEAVKDVESRDESYVLSVPEDGSTATITANNVLGLFRGLTTFGQLWYSAGGLTFMRTAPLNITDAPAFVSPKSDIFSLSNAQ